MDDAPAFAKDGQILNDPTQRGGQLGILDRELAKPYRIAGCHLHALELMDGGSAARVARVGGGEGAVMIALGD